MTSDDRPASRQRGPGRGRAPSGPGADDWLGDDTVEWFAPAPEPSRNQDPRAEKRSRRRQGTTDATEIIPPSQAAVPDLYRRRRFVGLVAVLLVVGVAVALAVTQLGGKDQRLAPPPTTGVTTTSTPVTTTSTTGTKTGTTTTTTTTSTSTSTSTSTTGNTKTIHVVVPASGSIKLGDKGSAVTELQLALKKLGYLTDKADGVFGPDTQAAVESFQTANGLPVDGVVGAKTAAKINAALKT